MTPWQLRQAVAALRDGGIIAYPTETVYGLGCDPLNPDAIANLLALKHRPIEKGIILIAADVDQLKSFIDVDDPELLNKLAQTTERPTTWICPARTSTPRWLCGQHNSIAVRISRHPTAQQLCQQFGGAIVSTSANPAGLKPAHTPLSVRHYFNGQLDYIIGGRCNPLAQPSRIVDITSGRLIRE